MNFSLQWLSSHIQGSVTAQQAASTLTLIGHEVESVEVVGSTLEGVVLGRVTSVSPHPDADRLRCCIVDVGGEPLPIVCGAPNVAEGQLVAVAKVESTLPIKDREGNPLVIREAKIRGQISRGMICAEDELGLGEDHSGIMVLNSKAEGFALGTALREVLGLSTDAILDVSLTPNRPDAASHRGLARDLAAALGLELKDASRTDEAQSTPAALPPLKDFAIRILAEKECPRYVARRISGVKVGPSPSWLQQKLRSIGLRPVNNVVDCTNLLLFDIGHPLHAFDASSFTTGEVRIRTFEEEMAFNTLDHVQRRIPAGSLFICDGDRPVALAGIMGGENSEIHEETTEVLLESAYFDPGVIRRTSRLTGLQTDASYRYERGMDQQICRIAADLAVEMIVNVCGGRVVEECTDVVATPLPRREIRFRPSQCERILGVGIPEETVMAQLKALGLQVSRKGDAPWVCVPPSFRPDLEREIDLVEEIGRLSDYNTLPKPLLQPVFTPEPIPGFIAFKERIRKLATRLRYKEILTNSLVSEEVSKRFAVEGDAIETLNPVSADATTLRTTLMGGLLAAFEFNIHHKSQNLRLFEIGHTYMWSESSSWISGIKEQDHLVLGTHGTVTTGQEWTKTADSTFAGHFTQLKGDLLSLFTTLGLADGLSEEIRTHAVMNCDELVFLHSGKTVASMVSVTGELAKQYDLTHSATLAEVALQEVYALVEAQGARRFSPIPKFPALEYDLAFIVDKTTPAYRLVDEIRESGGTLLTSIHLFDLFEGEPIGAENKSLAFRLVFQDPNKTLNSNIIEPIIKKIIHILQRKVNAELRA